MKAFMFLKTYLGKLGTSSFQINSNLDESYVCPFFNAHQRYNHKSST